MKHLFINWLEKRKFMLAKLSPTQTIVAGFVLLILVGTVLLSLPVAARSGYNIGPIDALFTATSAVCVTGLVVVDTNSAWTLFGQFVILLLIQIGGLGIMSAATLFSLIVGRRMGLKERLTIQESLNEFNLSGVVKTLKTILIATFIIEAAGAVILSTRLIPLYGIKDGIIKSVFHSVSAFCNAGFDIFGSRGNEFTSLSAFNNEPLIVLPISFLFILGGLGFVVWKDVVTVRKFSDFMLHTKVVLLATAVLIVSGTIMLFIFEYNNPATLKELPLLSKIMNAYFHAVTPRTAGFNTLSIGEMTGPSKFLNIFLMFIGAAPGSTAGGVKVTTFSVVLFAVISYIRGQEDVNMLRRRVPGTMLHKSLSIIIIGMTIVSVTTMVLLFSYEGDFMQVLFESVSAFGTVGLSTGITPDLCTFSKIQIIITMFFGRVGPLSAAIFITMRQNNRKLPYKYPEGKINVG